MFSKLWEGLDHCFKFHSTFRDFWGVQQYLTFSNEIFYTFPYAKLSSFKFPCELIQICYNIEYLGESQLSTEIYSMFCQAQPHCLTILELNDI